MLSARAAQAMGAGAASTWQRVIALGRTPGMRDLGQGYPDFAGSSAARQAAVEAISDDSHFAPHQYAPITGTPTLLGALSAFYARRYGSVYEPGSEICVTASATEALYCTIQALVDPGDEVVVFEPFFPWYVPHIRLAGGVPKIVTLQPPRFEYDADLVRAAFSDRTKLVIFNSPHNPTGHVATEAELATVAELCAAHDVLAVSDEVYETCTFGGAQHRRLCDVPGMRDRTVTIGSASKMFSLTGWRVGWVYGPENLIAGVRTMHGFCSYSAPTPLQDGVAAALADEAAVVADTAETARQFEANFQALGAVLTEMGLTVCEAQGGYFLVADVSSTGMTGSEYFEWLAEHQGVVCCPLSIFYTGAAEGAESAERCVRFAVCKSRAHMEAACRALRAKPTQSKD